VLEYTVFTCPTANDVVLILRTVGVIVRESVTDFDCAGTPASVTVNVNCPLVSALVGVPAINPLEAFRVTPTGRVPLKSDHVYGAVPPLAANVVEYAVPTCPLGNELVVMASALAVIVSVSETDLV
jgi:hypothetical protein